MTSILTRSPLQHMPMNRAAHSSGTGPTRRRSARQLDDNDDDAGPPPAKKMKSDAPEKKGAMGGVKTNGAGGRKGKKAYEEQDEGFTFTRAGAKRGRGKADKVEEPAGQEDSKSASPQRPAQMTKKRPRKTLPTTPEQEVSKVRRSKRLSGENEAQHTEPDDPFIVRTGKKAPSAEPASKARPERNDRDGSPAVVQNGGAPGTLHVQKKRTPRKIDLLFSETPVIRRNKEMRKTSAESNRRSSAGLRGKRASSLIDAGTSSAVPHTEVQTEDFYKHIGQDLLEPKRMKQLLVWCANRAVGEKQRGGEAEEVQAGHAARVVQDELLAEFTNRSELSNWFDRTDEATQNVSLIKKPNPRNVQNVAKLAELEGELLRLQAEKRSWDELLSSVPVPSSQTQPSDLSHPPPAPSSPINATLLNPDQQSILQTLLQPLPDSSTPQTLTNQIDTDMPTAPAPTTTLAQTQERLDRAASGLHFKLDAFADALHRIDRYVDTAGRAAERIGVLSAARLKEREEARRDRGERENGGVRVADRDVLKALGRVLDGDGRR